MQTAAMADQRTPGFTRARPVALVAALTAIAFGVLVVQGYVYGVGPLRPLSAVSLRTPPLVAVLFVLTGVSLLSYRVGMARYQQITALFTALIAAVVLCEYVFGLSLGIDRLLFPEAVLSLSPVHPGRPAPITSAAFLLLGSALFTAGLQPGPEPRRWHTALVLGAIVLPVIPIVGLLFGVPELYALAPGVGTALDTALVLLLLAVGVAAATHGFAILAPVQAREPDAILLRRMLPLAVLLPLLFAAGTVRALRSGLSATHFDLILYVSGCIGMLLVVAYWLAAAVRRADAERRAADAELRAADKAQAELAVQEVLMKAESAAAASAREADLHTRELLDILGQAAVFARGLDGRIRFWSAGAGRLYGWSAEEATGAASRDLLHTRLPLPGREAEAELLRADAWHGEIVRRRRNGERVHVASHWILRRDHLGRPDAVIEVDNDVTEQRRAEKAFREGEARYRAVVAATAQIVWTTSPDGGRPLDITEWETFTGQSQEEADWGGWMQAIHPDDRPEAERLWRDALRRRTPLLTEHRLRRRDGEYRHMEGRAVPVLDDLGTVREWVWAHADITERVMTQERLGQAQKLQAVGTLAGGVAHEVNNQVMAVLGFGDFVLQALGPGHPQAGDVEEMLRGATRAAKIAQQLLTFSRRQVNQIGLLDLQAAVVALTPTLTRLLGADKTLQILTRPSGRKVLADPTQVDQVLINLVANARDAMGTGGRLTIATDEVVLDESYARAHSVSRFIPGCYVRLTVSDTGSGMDRQTLAKIFEPFFTTKPMGLGTGLGLSTVYGIVKQHDGFVWAYSEPGLGTTIKVYLPAALSEPYAVPGSTSGLTGEPAASSSSAVVLVVEDEPPVRNLIRRSLEEAGLTVVDADDGRHALEKVATLKAPPDLVLTDVIMPGLNGRELSEALALAQPGIPVLFMSGYTGDDVLARSLLPPSAPFIQKPFSPEELVARVRLLLAGAARTAPLHTSPPASNTSDSS